ncbi:Multiple myeloma tumor-associated protein 2 [Thelohanellus kitauei]|uniref:Multiple myeloma tumor-associated protein 2 n=1 Tax=Thelohanellus kitauei TaxID=669202 RepID=A0A0C2N261_THEKT|nr:Multiple myeloma tumor-associated protein 2 [Thelohanellus kitauei]
MGQHYGHYNIKYMFKTFDYIDDPIRGGVRGGRDQFTWEQVKLDRDRENYLGHSVKAPVGRSQGGPDFLWYEKHSKKQQKKTDPDEKKRVIELERQAMSRVLNQSYNVGSKPLMTPSHPLVTTPSVKPEAIAKNTDSSHRSKVKKSKSEKRSKKEHRDRDEKSRHSHHRHKDKKRK